LYLSLLIPVKLHQAMKLNMKHRNPHKWTQRDLSRIWGDCLLVQVFLTTNHRFCENHPSIKSPDDPSGQQESPIHRMLLSCSTETACNFLLRKLQCKCLRNRTNYPKIQSACERTHWNHIFSAAHDLFSSLPDWALNPASTEISASLKLCVQNNLPHCYKFDWNYQSCPWFKTCHDAEDLGSNAKMSLRRPRSQCTYPKRTWSGNAVPKTTP